MSKYPLGIYGIIGLGTPQLKAWVKKGGQWLIASPQMTADLKQRAAGQNRSYALSENFFDSVSGTHGNWWGSHVGGGKTGLKPGGIGDVNVGYANLGDIATKKHDIASWLEANFEIGSIVFIKQNQAWIEYTVKDFGRVQFEVVVELTGIKLFEGAIHLLNSRLKSRHTLILL